MLQYSIKYIKSLDWPEILGLIPSVHYDLIL